MTLSIIWKAIWGFLLKIPWQVYAVIALLLACWLYGHWRFEQGKFIVQSAWDEEKSATAAMIKQLQEKANQVNTQVETRVVTQTRVIHEKGDTIIREIPKYIPVDTPNLPGGFRLLHDAAATNSIPESSRLATTAPVSVADATETITNNYTTCHQWRTQLEGWQDWYKQQSNLQN